MAVIETWFEQDLQKPVKVRYIDGNLFSHNGNGNRIGVVITNNGEPVTLTGTVSGYAVLADGTTVPCTGSRSGNKASILVPAAAYSPGSILISIFLTDGTTVTTLAALSSSVIMARTGNQIDPGSVVTDWTNTINAAMQSVETAAANLGNIIATPYANLTFPVPLGKYTIYNNGLYRCISPIASSEEWTAAHWTNVKLGDDVADLKSALDKNIGSRLTNLDGIEVPAMELGTIAMASSSIAFNNSTTNIRTPQNSNIRVSVGDVVGLSDYANAKYKIAILKDSDHKYTYTSAIAQDYTVRDDGLLYIVVAYADSAVIENISDLSSLVRIYKNNGLLSEVDGRLENAESFVTVNDTNSLPTDLFGPGTWSRGEYIPTFRPWRFSTKHSITLGFDLYVYAGQGFRFECFQYIDDAWDGGSWITSAKIPANTPFGLLMAHDAADEDTSSTATPEEFLPNFAFNTELTNKIADLDGRVTDLEQSKETDSAKVTEFMSHYYASNTAEAYAFFTDPHLMGSAGAFDEDTFNKYINVLSKTVKQTSAAYVVSGGDWLNREDSKAEAAAKLGYVDGTMRSIFPGKYYPIAGNHDFNYIGYEDGARLPESQWVSNTAMRNFWFHDHEQCYYKFKVMTAQNYVLNTRTDYDGTNSYDKTMLDWLAANLIEDDAPHSTIMFHIYFLSAVGTTIPTRVVAIGKIIAAFNAHSTCVLTNESDDYDKAYDFTGTTGHIDYVIVGHTHADFTDTFGGVPVVGCDNFTEGNVATFDMVFADYTNHKLYMTRFGSGESREFDI